MREDIAGPQGASSRPMWETLDGMVREKAQEFIQQIMEEEVTELLGREKSERRSTVDSAEGYRNGYGKPRRLAMSSGTITLRRPRVRGVEERFESRVLPLFARRTKKLGALLPELYLHGLAEGDFELAMRGLLGEGAPLSKSSIRRLRAGWTAEFEEWSQRRLEGREVVYVWADGSGVVQFAQELHNKGCFVAVPRRLAAHLARAPIDVVLLRWTVRGQSLRWTPTGCESPRELSLCILMGWGFYTLRSFVGQEKD